MDRTITIQPAGIDDWGHASSNMPIGPGDRVFADPTPSNLGRMQAGQFRVFFSAGADLTLTAMDRRGIEFRLASGTNQTRASRQGRQKRRKETVRTQT